MLDKYCQALIFFERQFYNPAKTLSIKNLARVTIEPIHAWDDIILNHAAAGLVERRSGCRRRGLLVPPRDDLDPLHLEGAADCHRGHHSARQWSGCAARA